MKVRKYMTVKTNYAAIDNLWYYLYCFDWCISKFNSKVLSTKALFMNFSSAEYISYCILRWIRIQKIRIRLVNIPDPNPLIVRRGTNHPYNFSSSFEKIVFNFNSIFAKFLNTFIGYFEIFFKKRIKIIMVLGCIISLKLNIMLWKCNVQY